MDLQFAFELKNNIFTKKLKSDNIVKSIQQCLLELSPNDELMRTSLEDGIYDKNKKTSRFILVNLERNDTNYFHKGNPDTLDKFNEDTNKRIWEIEHILPQTLNNEWRNEISPNDISKAEAIKNDVVHLLGNLTLTPYNSGLGNSSFKSKLEYRDKKTLVGLNLNIFLNNSIDKDRPTWGKTSILERNKILTDSFIQKWQIASLI